MIYCTIKPIEQYVEHINGAEMGLYTVYASNTVLLNLVTRVTTLPFMYEPGFEDVPLGLRLGQIRDERPLIESLGIKIAGETLAHIVFHTTPQEMLELFIKHSPKTPLNDLFGPNNIDALAATMKLRVLQYKKYYRGTIKKGKVTQAQFRSPLSKAEELFLYNSVGAMCRQYINSINKGSNRG